MCIYLSKYTCDHLCARSPMKHPRHLKDMLITFMILTYRCHVCFMLCACRSGRAWQTGDAGQQYRALHRMARHAAQDRGHSGSFK